MESEAAAALGYVNRPTGHAAQPCLRPDAAARETGHRPGLRIARVALRAYEQRAERRSALRVWLQARATATAGA